MIENLLANWKTTSAGLTAIVTSSVNLVFAVLHHSADQTTWIVSLLAILNGVGLLAAGDASKSQKDVKEVDAKVQETAKAVITGDTSILEKSAVTKPLDSKAPPTDVPPSK